MRSGWAEPLNPGQTQTVTINQLVDIIAVIANKRIGKHHDTTRPQGVRGRSSDNTTIRRVLGWEPATSLEAGLELTYQWITDRVASGLAVAAPPSLGRANVRRPVDQLGNGHAFGTPVKY